MIDTPTWAITIGDARTAIAVLPTAMAQCVVTSPPYWGLRDYDHVDQLGNEATPQAFADAIVAVFAQVRRVLRDDGVVWINLGDTYRGKTLTGIPWRVALAMVADGWRLRADVIWHNPHGRPESAADRPTRAHEYVFLFSKSATYRYDGDAIRRPYALDTLDQFRRDYDPGPSTKDYAANGVQSPTAIKKRIVDRGRADDRRGANARSVWTMGHDVSAFAHFAVMPRELARRCVRAGSSPGDVVFDPFAGAGTTGVVALDEGRSFIGVELNPAYVAIARARLAAVRPLFAVEASPCG